eukprot:TRINITY_DN18491_c0_g1_i1.p1 TRINITY_DN18491_c0_g1~~TRINITY_DN18491_c0_g1_i1.p1  ORF type:complete len:481 (+),score=148.87 TRINITY_DN18491_c0_g1_i1:62-1504(+)
MAEVRNEYLHKHELPELVDALVRRLLITEPADPIRFLIGDLVHHERQRSQAAAGRKQEQRGTPGVEPLSVGGSSVADDRVECWDYPSLVGCCSELAKVLTPDLYTQLRHHRTRHGACINDLIQIGVDVREHTFAHSSGCVAADAECFEFFNPLLSTIVRRRCPGWQGVHPEEDLEVVDLTDRAVFPSEIVLRTMATIDRGFSTCGFPSAIDRGGRRLVAAAVAHATNHLPSAGKWYSAPEAEERLAKRSQPTADGDATECLREQLLLPPLPLRSEYDAALRLTRDWPDGRGVWVSDDAGLAVWVNIYEHVHCRVVSEGGDMYKPLRRLFEAVQVLREHTAARDLHVARSSEFGSLVSNPDNLGTSLGCWACVRLPMLSAHQRFDQVLTKTGLAAVTEEEMLEATYFGLRRGHGSSEEHPCLSSATACSSGDGTCWVRLLVRLGVTESQAAAQFVAGVHRLIELERLLQKGQQIEIAIGLE